MATNLLSDLHISAALCEEVYRRSSRDQALNVEVDIGGRIITSEEVNVGDRFAYIDDYFYNDATGFVGRIIEVGDTVYVVYRGSDLGSGTLEMAKALVLGGAAGFPSNTTTPAADAYDWTTRAFPFHIGSYPHELK